MPFDGTITDFVAPDLTTPSVDALIYILEHPETWPKGWHWDFGQVKGGHACGTAGCAAGIATKLWGMNPSINVLCRALGISGYKAVQEIFTWGSGGSDITAGDVANRLRDWQAGRTIRWK